MIVRQDLSRSQQAVQAIHAAVEATRRGLIPSGIEHPSLVLCGEPNEDILGQLSDQLKQLGIRHIPFREPDRNDELTALATEPLTKAQRRRLRNLSLLTL